MTSNDQLKLEHHMDMFKMPRPLGRAWDVYANSTFLGYDLGHAYPTGCECKLEDRHLTRLSLQTELCEMI